MFGTKSLWTAEFLDQKRQVADPEADQLIVEAIEQAGPEAARHLFDMLTDKIDVSEARFPKVIQDFLLKEQQLPEWAEAEKIQLAEHFFIDHGPHILLILYFKSLPTLYACANGAQVLFQTGRLTHNPEAERKFARRIGQTGKFMLAVMLPERLKEHGRGMLSAKKIRIVHSAIRHFIPPDRWQETAWGKPINQEDLAITLMTFSVSILEGLDILGLKYTDEEAEAYTHVWKIVGHFLGIQHGLIPDTFSDGKFLLNKILERQAAHSEAGKILTQALISFTDNIIPGKIIDTTSPALMRTLLSPKLIDVLDLNIKIGFWGRILPAFIRGVFQLEERLDYKDSFIAEKIHVFSVKLTHKMVSKFLEEANDHPREQSAFLKRWELNER